VERCDLTGKHIFCEYHAVKVFGGYYFPFPEGLKSRYRVGDMKNCKKMEQLIVRGGGGLTL